IKPVRLCLLQKSGRLIKVGARREPACYMRLDVGDRILQSFEGQLGKDDVVACRHIKFTDGLEREVFRKHNRAVIKAGEHLAPAATGTTRNNRGVERESDRPIFSTSNQTRAEPNLG